MATNPANVYCAIADVVDVISNAGVSLAADDNPPTAYGGAIAKAGNTIDKFLLRRYTPESLAQSDLIKDFAAIIAAYKLRTRRGNPAPPSLQIAYDEVILDLKEIKLAQNDVPGIAARKSYAPGMSKMLAVQRPYPRTVVVRSQSTHAGGDPAGYAQHTDPIDRVGGNDHLDYAI